LNGSVVEDIVGNDVIGSTYADICVPRLEATGSDVINSEKAGSPVKDENVAVDSRFALNEV